MLTNERENTLTSRPSIVPRWLKAASLIVLAVFLLSAGGLLWLRSAGVARLSRPDPAAPDPGLGELAIPEFSLLAQDNRPLSRADLRGRVTVVDFIFTHCPFVCPTLTSTMRELSDALGTSGKIGERVRYLSVSVDPARDTPAVLRGYARNQLADTRRWTFATGDKAEVDRIVQQGLQFVLQDDPKNPIALPASQGGGTMNNIIHPGWFVLVGPDVRVLGIYRPSEPEQLAALRGRIEAIVRTLP
jgi:protein SCO1